MSFCILPVCVNRLNKSIIYFHNWQHVMQTNMPAYVASYAVLLFVVVQPFPPFIPLRLKWSISVFVLSFRIFKINWLIRTQVFLIATCVCCKRLVECHVEYLIWWFRCWWRQWRFVSRLVVVASLATVESLLIV